MKVSDPGALEMQRPTRWLSTLVFSISLWAMLSATAEEKETAAVLKLHEVSFVYRTSSSVLSCGEIRGRVVSVLRTLGAREDLDVRVNGCDTVVTTVERDRDTWPTDSPEYGHPSDPWRRPTDPLDPSADPWDSSDRFRNRRMGPRQSAHVRIRAMMPVEMTPEVQAELEKDKSRRELVSRVNPSAGLGEPIVFPAQRQKVELSRSTIDLAPEECELMQQMSRGIFKDLGIRIVRRGPSCARDRMSHIPPSMTVEALLPVLPTVPTLSPASEEQKEKPREQDEKGD